MNRRLLLIAMLSVSLNANAVIVNCHFGDAQNPRAPNPTLYSANWPENLIEYALVFAMRANIAAYPYWPGCNFENGVNCVPDLTDYVAAKDMPTNYFLLQSGILYNAKYFGKFFLVGGAFMWHPNIPYGYFQATTQMRSCNNEGGWMKP